MYSLPGFPSVLRRERLEPTLAVLFQALFVEVHPITCAEFRANQIIREGAFERDLLGTEQFLALSDGVRLRLAASWVERRPRNEPTVDNG